MNERYTEKALDVGRAERRDGCGSKDAGRRLQKAWQYELIAGVSAPDAVERVF